MALSTALLALLLALPVQAPAPQDTPGDTLEETLGLDALLERIDELLRARYVVLATAEACGLHLAEARVQGRFEGLTGQALAAELTATLQETSHDKHLRVRQRRPRPSGEASDAAAARGRDEMRQGNFGFVKVELLEGNVGYVDMRGFAPAVLGRATATAALNFIANADAVIFDMRRNGGGSPDMVQFVCSWFFDEPTHLNSLYWREGDRLQEFWTLPELPGRRMPDVPLYVLTSRRTFSGAEEFCYNLKTRERATLIGETTGGGANPGGVELLDAAFEMFIPVGRAVNPVTGTNWEGVGVTPDVECDADAAFERALAEARTAAVEYRERTEAERTELWRAILGGVDDARRLLQADDPDGAQTAIDDALHLALDAQVLDESAINLMGYEQLGEENVAVAIAIFRFNTHAFPRSSNAWDSLGEAYLAQGERTLARECYAKALELDPENQNARARAEALREQQG